METFFAEPTASSDSVTGHGLEDASESPWRATWTAEQLRRFKIGGSDSKIRKNDTLSPAASAGARRRIRNYHGNSIEGMYPLSERNSGWSRTCPENAIANCIWKTKEYVEIKIRENTYPLNSNKNDIDY